MGDTFTTPLLWRETGAPFAGFLRFSEWLFSTAGRRHEIALNTLVELLFRYLTTELRGDPAVAARALWNDWQRVGRFDPLPCFQPHLSPEELQDARRHRSLQKRKGGRCNGSSRT